MHIIQRVPSRVKKKMYLASERQVVNNVGVGSGARYNYSGLGEVDGMFNIGKMFTRMFTFKKHSFDYKNIIAGVGSVVGTIATGPIGQIVKPGMFSQHSKASQFVGGLVTPYNAFLPTKLTGLTHAEMTGSYVGLATAAVIGGGMVLAPMMAGGAAAAETGGMMAAGSGVLAPVAEAAEASSFFTLPSVVSTGSTLMSAGSGVLAPVAESGFMATAGSVLSTVGSGIASVAKAVLPTMLTSMFGGGGGGQQQQGGMTQAEYDAQQKAAYDAGQQQAAYDAQIRAQQNQMYMPGGYNPSIPFVGDQYAGAVAATPSSGSYGDLRTPYTAIQEDGTQVQVDPATGQIVQAGIIPDLSPTTWLAIGGVTLVGWYFMSGNKSTN